jgi:hypothetical protein
MERNSNLRKVWQLYVINVVESTLQAVWITFMSIYCLADVTGVTGTQTNYWNLQL